MKTPRPFTRNRRIATAMLVAMTVVFFGTLFVPNPSNWVLFAQAVAEAGMIGGLADWFAVAALFRHPLGIPIPHTALLPNSKDRVARNVGDFVTSHFLKPELVKEKLLTVNIAKILTDWVLEPGNANILSWKLSAILQASIKGSQSSEPVDFFKGMLKTLLMRPKSEAFIRSQVDALLTSNLRGEMTDHALLSVRKLINANRENITKVVQSRSRWWVGSSTDRRLSQFLVDELIKLIDDLSDELSPIRQDFDKALSGFASDSAQSEKISATLQALILRLVDSPEFDEMIETFMRGLRRSLDEDLAHGTSLTVNFIEAMLISVAQRISANDQDMIAINVELSTVAGAFTTQVSSSVSEFITTTIQSWDTHDMVTLFEDQVGNDLQFIRMNGTILGGLIGGALFGITHLLHLAI